MGNRCGGFALVVALSLMGFIFLLVVSMVSLSVVGVQTTNFKQQETEAEEMARLGLQVALGQLQALAGPDQRITASAGIGDLDPLTADIEGIEQPLWLGVWNTAEHSQDGANNPKFGQMEGWLVSGNNPNPLEELTDPVTVFNRADPTASSAVVVNKVNVSNAGSGSGTTGAYAYAVFDESQKAQLTAGSHAVNALSKSEIPDSRLVLSGAGGVDADALYAGADDSEWSTQLVRKPSRSQFSVINEDFSDEPGRFHAFTDGTFSLQTNPREGGLKRDLSLAFEMDQVGSDTNSLTYFNASEFVGDGSRTGNDMTSAIEQNHGEDFYARFLFAESVDNGVSDNSGEDLLRGPTWHLLRDYYNLYKHVIGPRSSSPILGAQPMFPNTPEVPSTIADSIKGTSRSLDDYIRYQGNVFNGILWSGDSGANEYATSLMGSNVLGYGNRPTRGNYAPLMQRVIYNFSVMNIDGNFALVMAPIVVLWNPYNVDISMHAGLKIIQDNLPVYFHVRLERTDGKSEEYLADYRTLHKAYGNTAQGKDLQLFITDMDDLSFEPGEIKIFSLPDSAPVAYDTLIGSSNSPNLYLRQGVRYNGGTYYQEFNKLTSITGGEPVFESTGVTIPLEEQTSGSMPIAAASSLSVELYPAHLNGDSSAVIQTNNIGAGQNYNYLLTSVFSVDPADLPDSARGHWKGDRQIQYLHTPLSHGGTHELYVDLAVEEQLLDVPVLLGIPGVRLELFNIDYRLLPAHDTSTASLFEDFNPRSAVRSTQTSNFPRATAPQALISSEPQSSLASVIESSGSNAFWGDTLGGAGETHVTAWEIPTAPLLSLAALQHADVALLDYQSAHAIGNSSASPYVPLDELYEFQTATSPSRNSTVYDLSYYANQALWDGYFFSGLAPEFSGTGSYSETKSLSDVIDAWTGGGSDGDLRDPRVHFLRESEFDLETVRSTLKGPEGYREVAAQLLVEGGFNVNSVSVDAWEAVLARALGDSAEVEYLSTNGSLNKESTSGVPFSSFTLPNGASGEPWNGFRRFSRPEIRALAEAIVEQVKRRGPFLSLADFVNRDLEDDAFAGDLRLSGALQSAIDAVDLNASIESEGTASVTSDFVTPVAASGSTTRGIAGSITQADVLTSLGATLAVRGDTFTIRAYGEVTHPFTAEVTRRWCEAQVQRYPDFINAADNEATDDRVQWSAENENWGRAFRIISFRWLEPDEV
ncbi:hypothetical protein GCM10007047_29290 [Cerasicoccus arenae]|uniref:Uncharacterized protein n=2 Tax=Cerasicoccus arenae TaxID=424488 RepID=A0A8J3DCN4_9BACT|nr:hypothetical protein [Cerasicoccus arenae]GHC10136.1 hypothetical protein GCM10007047_29290 [Cerasicoccus arenae]